MIAWDFWYKTCAHQQSDFKKKKRNSFAAHFHTNVELINETRYIGEYHSTVITGFLVYVNEANVHENEAKNHFQINAHNTNHLSLARAFELLPAYEKA
jgi:hypothetical protein